MSPTTVPNLEAGKVSEAQRRTTRKLAQALGVDPGELVGDYPLHLVKVSHHTQYLELSRTRENSTILYSQNQIHSIQFSYDAGSRTEVRMREVGAEIRRLREGRGWTGAQLAVYAGMAPSAVSQIETGKRSPNTGSLAKIARALEVELADLFPKALSGSSLEPALFNGRREEERPTARWSSAVDGAQRLRETGAARIRKALSEWSASKQRGEPYAARREYLDEMGNLLQEVYDADGALGWAYIEAALTQGGSEAKVPSYLREESRTMGHFYGELLGLVKSAGLSVRTGVAPASAKRDAKVRSETTPHSVEEPKAA